MGTDWKELTESAKFRSNIYALLAAIFRQEPSLSLIRKLRDPHLLGIFSDLDVELGEDFLNTDENELVEILSLEFTRLFIGPDCHISAHESIFAEMDQGIGGLWGTKTVEVKHFIETTGLNYNPEFTGVPDHVSVELEFMQKLTEWEADQWAQKDRENAQYCQSVQRLFLRQHPILWITQFCDRVIAEAEMPFYRAMSELTKNYLEFEQHNIKTSVAA